MAREVVQIVELLQPSCSLVWGQSPCSAAGNAARKCFNTRKTCQDVENFTLSSTSIFFVTGDIAGRDIDGVTYAIPLLKSVSTVPSKVNFAGANHNMQAFGTRATCSIAFGDAPYDDTLVDPYVSERDYTPEDLGTFWGAWLQRNPYYTNMTIKVYEGFLGDALSEMSVRTYFTSSVSQSSNGGGVSIVGRDILARVEEKNGQCPVISTGVVYQSITDSAATFRVSNAEIDDYSSSGMVRIDDEIVTYTSITESEDGLYIQFEGSSRGTNGTEAAPHDIETTVQQCASYFDQEIPSVLYDLLVTYCGVGAEYLDVAGWNQEVSELISDYRINRIISEPESVQELISQIQNQCLIFMWWDERTALVKMKVVRGLTEYPEILSDNDNILSGLSVKQSEDQRASQVWYWYGRTDSLSDVSEIANYNGYVTADVDSESEERYGSASIREIFGTWVSSRLMAKEVGERILQRYVDIPKSITFSMDLKDRAYGVGDPFYLEHYLFYDEWRQPTLTTWLITSYEEKLTQGVVTYTAEDITSYGRNYYFMASDATDYDGSRVFKSAYWGDDNGELNDGTIGARYS